VRPALASTRNENLHSQARFKPTIGWPELAQREKKQIAHPAKGAGIRDDSCSVPIAAARVDEDKLGPVIPVTLGRRTWRAGYRKLKKRRVCRRSVVILP